MAQKKRAAHKTLAWRWDDYSNEAALTDGKKRVIPL
jgi:hypothetical protein